MNEPTPENKPSDLEAKIVEFTAHIKMYAVPPRKINAKEKSELKKLKVLLDDLTSEAFSSTEGIRIGTAGPIEPPDTLDSNDL